MPRKITTLTPEAARRLYAAGKTREEIASEYGISPSRVSRIKGGDGAGATMPKRLIPYAGSDAPGMSRTPLNIKGERYQIVEPSPRRYRVLDADTGEYVSGTLSQAGAEAKRAILIDRGDGKMRKCMRCGVEFVSTGPGNRLCVEHRHADASLEDARWRW